MRAGIGGDRRAGLGQDRRPGPGLRAGAPRSPPNRPGRRDPTAPRSDSPDRHGGCDHLRRRPDPRTGPGRPRGRRPGPRRHHWRTHHRPQRPRHRIGRPFTAIVDALDEAADPSQLITRVLRPIIDHGTGVRLLLGTRPHLMKLIQPPAPQSRSGVIDLDAPRWADRQALTVYTIRNLLEATPDSAYRYAEPGEVRRSPGRSPPPPIPPSWSPGSSAPPSPPPTPSPTRATRIGWPDLPRLPGDAMRQDLEPGSAPTPQRARDLLRPLAYAEGQGLPWEDIWAPLASRICGRTYTDEDLHWLRPRRLLRGRSHRSGPFRLPALPPSPHRTPPRHHRSCA